MLQCLGLGLGLGFQARRGQSHCFVGNELLSIMESNLSISAFISNHINFSPFRHENVQLNPLSILRKELE